MIVITPVKSVRAGSIASRAAYSDGTNVLGRRNGGISEAAAGGATAAMVGLGGDAVGARVGAGEEHAAKRTRIDVWAARTSRTIRRIAYHEAMRCACVVLALALAGCEPPPGLTVEVVVDGSTQRVELFLGDDCHSDCPDRIVVPDVGPRPVTDAYLVADARPWSIDASGFVDGVAGFEIQGPTDARLGILVVVAYDAQDQIIASATLHDVEVPADRAERWRIQLAATSTIDPAVVQPPPGSIRIKAWRQPSQRLAACLLVEHWGDSSVTRELVVPEADTDCDELVNECAPWSANAVGEPPTIDEASCVTHATNTNLCVLGGPECNETSPQTGETCIPLDEQYCVPDAFCSCRGATDQGACLREKLAEGIALATMPFLKCTIPIADGVPCNGQTRYEIDATPWIVSSEGTKCKGLGLNEIDLPLGEFDGSLALEANSAAYLKVEHFTPCKADLVWGGKASTVPADIYGALAIELDNDRHLVIPMRVELGADCGTPARCSLFRANALDSMWTCLGAPAPVGACAPAVDQGCLGPFCNGECCGAGEMCTPNGCACAAGPRCDFGDSCEIGPPNPDQCGQLCCGSADNLCPF